MTETIDISLHHGAISVCDMDQSIAFYERVLGFEVDTCVSLESKGMQFVHMKRGMSYIELICVEGAADLPVNAQSGDVDLWTIGTKHIAFSTPDAEATHERLKAFGVDGLTELQTGDFYKYFYFKDPDGIVLEVVCRLS